MSRKRGGTTTIPKRVRFETPISSQQNYQPNKPTRTSSPSTSTSNIRQGLNDLFEGIICKSIAMFAISFNSPNTEVPVANNSVKMDEFVTVSSEGVEYEVSTYELMKLLFQDEYATKEKIDPPGTPADGNGEPNFKLGPDEDELIDEASLEKVAPREEEACVDEAAGSDDNQDISDDDNKTTSSMSTFHQIATRPPANGRTYHDPDKDFVGAAMEAAISATAKLATCMSWEAAASPSSPPSTPCLPPSDVVQDSINVQTKSDPTASAPSNAMSVVDPVALREYATAADPSRRQSLKEMITEQILIGLGFKTPKQAADNKEQSPPNGEETSGEGKVPMAIGGEVVQDVEENVGAEESTIDNENVIVQEETDNAVANTKSIDVIERDAVVSDFANLVKTKNGKTAFHYSWSKSGTNSFIAENEDELSSTINKNQDDAKTEILKAMVIKCLVRNQYASKMNHKKSRIDIQRELPVHSQHSVILDEVTERSVKRDPSTEGVGEQGDCECEDKRDEDALDRVKPRDPPETGTSDRSITGFHHSTIPRHISTCSYPRGDRSVVSSILFPRPETRPMEWRRSMTASSTASGPKLRSPVPQSVQRQIAIDQERVKRILNKYSSTPTETRPFSQRSFRASAAVNGLSTSVPSYGTSGDRADREKVDDIINGSAIMRRRRYKEQLMKERNGRRYATE